MWTNGLCVDGLISTSNIRNLKWYKLEQGIGRIK